MVQSDIAARYSTAHTPRTERASHWGAIISDAYFPLNLTFRDPLRFDGRLSHLGLGNVGLSRLTSEPVQYERRQSHIKQASEEKYLVTIPKASAVEFRQMGKEVRCEPGGFIIERGDEPYLFKYEKPNDLFVLKVSKSDLGDRVHHPDRFCARAFDATQGSARLFTSMVVHAQKNAQGAGHLAETTLGRQLLELLVLALTDDAPSGETAASAVRTGHLERTDRFIRAHLEDAALSPEMIANACGISKRYLHDLYRNKNATVSQQIRDYRLMAARDQLALGLTAPMSDIAYRFGFPDQANFSRLFKARFGTTPSAYRAAKRR